MTATTNITEKFPSCRECDGEVCLGFFLCCNDEETFHVERCDTCRRFETDFDAGAALQITLHKLGEMRALLV